jgi:2,3-bisphosphoglycerate-independent phosphoglycerate mutase
MNLKELIKETKTKIVMLIADGIGGLPHPDFEFKTELEYARTRNLDDLAKKSVLGLMIPVEHGIAPGSGPAHLALFGYDPLRVEIGRGVLEALGIGMELTERDVAVRGNFATVNESGIVTDRRAGRIETSESRKLVERIQEVVNRIEDVEIIVKPGKEHRFVLVLRGDGLEEGVSDTDPQKEGVPPLEPKPLRKEAEKTVRILKTFIERALGVIKSEPKANAILLRGVAKVPKIEPFSERYHLRPLALATYPMYKGITRLLKMETPDPGDSFDDLVAYMREHWQEYDFFYLHYKDTDKAGEDGDFMKKVKTIEELDKRIPEILSLNPDVLVITGDHSTPALWGAHSWHPNPLLLYSKFAGADDADQFTERVCKKGYLGTFYAKDLMTILLANAGRLKKYGA